MPVFSSFRPYVVGVTWVLECARQGTQVQEEDFLALELTYQEATTEIGRPQSVIENYPSLIVTFDTRSGEKINLF